MSNFDQRDIIDYYDQTEIHYKRAWDLEESEALHYGYQDGERISFRASLAKLNEELMKFGAIDETDEVLDAGCGVGGSSIFLARNPGCKRIVGINITPSQIEHAQGKARRLKLHNVTFQLANYESLPFADESFSVIWAVESLVHSNHKDKFFQEAFRVLKPGGRILIAEYVKSSKKLSGKDNQKLQDWLRPWAISDLNTLAFYEALSAPFTSFEAKNVSKQIEPSAWRMYYGSFFMRFLSFGYRLLNPKVRHFADGHYKGLYHQYPALKKELWQYYFMKIVK